MADHPTEGDSRAPVSTEQDADPAAAKGLRVSRYFTKPNVHPYDDLEWVERRSAIYSEKGETIFEVDNVRVPKEWSQLATDIMVSKYFRRAGVPETGSERGADRVIHRVAHTIRVEGERAGYFASAKDAETFEMELTHLLVHQMGAFNSPVWFNCGLSHEYGIKGSTGNWWYDEMQGQAVEILDSYAHPQNSACFIQSVDDDLMSIFDLTRNEARLFKYGSGTGTNFSGLRGNMERLSSGGTSSGLMSFLEVLDRGAGATKSGGTTRRAAKMVILDMDHPEIESFINWKVREEEKVAALVAAGFTSDFNGEAYKTVSGQNSNNSVRITDAFMEAHLKDGSWNTSLRTTGEVHKTHRARELMNQVAHAAWSCADPGVQFDSTINDWHTCSNTDRISASNPCSEYMFLNDSACNLASLNLVKFLNDDGTYDVPAYEEAIRTFTIAMEIIVGFSSYPTEQICENSAAYRPLGLGYANLGSLLMIKGIPYESESAYAMTGGLTAVLTGKAYATSAELARVKGAFDGFADNREPMLRVMNKHRAAVYRISADSCPPELLRAAEANWNDAVRLGERHGFRNAQATVLAPTGTIGLFMDCDTTGIEPDFALVKFKKLAGGGYFKIINQSVPRALEALGYSEEEVERIVEYAQGTANLLGAPYVNVVSLEEHGLRPEDIERIEKALPGAMDLSGAINVWTLGEKTLKRLGFTPEEYNDDRFNVLRALGFTAEQVAEANRTVCGAQTVEGAPDLKEEHYAVFDCANKCGKHGERFIGAMGHVRIMAAAQPFISGAISKTVNLPNEATAEDILDVYVEAWRLGLKAIAVYRDGSKISQPLSASADEVEEAAAANEPVRRRLPDERQSVTHKFSVGEHEGYITVGLYEDGKPGEMFLTMSKEGSTISGLMDAFATMTSLALQYGVPLDALVRKFSHMRFEPQGFTSNKQIPMAKSLVDYIFRWMALKFLDDASLAGSAAAYYANADDAAPAIPAGGPVRAKVSGLTDALAAASSEPSAVATQTGGGDAEHTDGVACHVCGTIMLRSGTCYVCPNCGGNTGCG
ncbi:vitamin B12-dependent ribonucleotide reductase [Candidatus Poribacteria bacterium]|jgi:ribonucleoside-diphosphate reductase alpha chain|nr:vitamin B12-dependent ribonucleotide reductase [Candidatus Poribacteria bacterium]MBT7097386.1 vitamin B12-dependent ribonucleotide reductase [Candidatus Poribacteria bacterium]MBT7806402.1 vitamin B12-dependent ribonucleotide reductase [Candidatus Poribacteria bacterium]